MEEEGDEEEHLGDDQEGRGQLGGDDLQHSPLLRVSEVTHPGCHPDLSFTVLHILQTILARSEDVVMQVEASRGQMELTRLIIEDSFVTLRLAMNCQYVTKAVIAMDWRLEFITLSEDTLAVLRKINIDI